MTRQRSLQQSRTVRRRRRPVALGASQLPEPGATATTSQGIAALYDIDLSTTSFFGLGASKADAGACGIVSDPATYTGRVYVVGNSISSFIFFVP